MKELPILFNDEMVRAILDGRKTQTRRPVKPQPNPNHEGPFLISNGGWVTCENEPPDRLKCYPLKSPFGQPGDLLYVRETWATCYANQKPYYIYREECDGGSRAWRASIHMPKKAVRIWLKVGRVWVERV
jgi:hypothetical protein